MKHNNQNSLQTIRKKLGLKQTKVAMDLNTTQETISSYETGRVFPSSDMLIQLADYYNTSIDYLLLMMLNQIIFPILTLSYLTKSTNYPLLIKPK